MQVKSHMLRHQSPQPEKNLEIPTQYPNKKIRFLVMGAGFFVGD